jgi:alpha-tubulin suppressor-like RCC1 family protein
MATKTGVWDLQEVRDKQLASEWSYSSNADPGQLWATGYSNWGKLGQNDRTYRSSPVQVGTEDTWMQIDGGGFDSVGGVKSDGTLWTWGQNWMGKLGLNQGGTPGVSRSSPTQVGTDTTWVAYSGFEAGSYGIKTDGTLWGWGVQGQWGSPSGSPAGHRSSPTQVTGTWGAEKGKIATWTDTFAAISSSGKLYAWGRNYSGHLGQNQAEAQNYSENAPLLIGTDTTWDTVGGVTDQGYYMPTALKTDGTLWSWGSGSDGQLGNNDTVSRSSPTQIGTDTTWSNQFAGEGSKKNKLAIKTDGTLWAWGGQDEGQLGLNQSGTHYSSPTQVGTETTWTAISAASSVVGTKSDGTLWVWGQASSGQLGQNNVIERSSPTQIPGTNWNSTSINALQANIFALRYS